MPAFWVFELAIAAATVCIARTSQGQIASEMEGNKRVYVNGERVTGFGDRTPFVARVMVSHSQSDSPSSGLKSSPSAGVAWRPIRRETNTRGGVIFTNE
jgi:hypothetical protein